MEDLISPKKVVEKYWQLMQTNDFYAAADSFQVRNVSEQRFVKKLGLSSKEQLKSIHYQIIKTLNIDLKCF